MTAERGGVLCIKFMFRGKGCTLPASTCIMLQVVIHLNTAGNTVLFGHVHRVAYLQPYLCLSLPLLVL